MKTITWLETCGWMLLGFVYFLWVCGCPFVTKKMVCFALQRISGQNEQYFGLLGVFDKGDVESSRALGELDQGQVSQQLGKKDRCVGVVLGDLYLPGKTHFAITFNLQKKLQSYNHIFFVSGACWGNRQHAVFARSAIWIKHHVAFLYFSRWRLPQQAQSGRKT